jgi:hypothetical protein
LGGLASLSMAKYAEGVTNESMKNCMRGLRLRTLSRSSQRAAPRLSMIRRRPTGTGTDRHMDSSTSNVLRSLSHWH